MTIDQYELSRAAEPKRCGAQRRQGEPGETCRDWATPFGTRCRRHGGFSPYAREAARQLFADYQTYSTDPVVLKRIRMAKYTEATERWEMRQARKAGREAVAGLLRSRAAWQAAKRREAAEHAAARAQRNEDYKKAHRLRPKPVASEAIPFDAGLEWDI